jgi:hypothetical protein
MPEGAQLAPPKDGPQRTQAMHYIGWPRTTSLAPKLAHRWRLVGDSICFRPRPSFAHSPFRPAQPRTLFNSGTSNPPGRPSPKAKPDARFRSEKALLLVRCFQFSVSRVRDPSGIQPEATATKTRCY